MLEDWVSPRQGRREAVRGFFESQESLATEHNDSDAGWALTEQSLIEIFVRLPFALPIDDRLHAFPLSYAYTPSASNFWRNQGPPVVQVRALTIHAPWSLLLRPGLFEGLRELLQEELPVPDGKVDGAPEPQGTVDTWLSIVSPAALLEGEDDLLEGVLERGLGGVNRLVRATKILTRDARLSTLALEDLEPVAFWRVRDSEGGAGPIALLPLEPEWRLFATPLSGEANDSVDQLVDMQGQHHPFFTYRDWFERARHSREHRGDTVSAVICLQTAIESLLFNVWYMTHVDLGISADALAVLRDDPPSFRTLLTKHLHASLGGSWDATRGTVGRYWTDLYLLRNRTAHGGHTPTYAEMESAFRASERLMEHLMARLRANSGKYPRTLFALAGRDGLERRGWLTRRLREVSDAMASEDMPFWWPADAANREDQT